MRHRHRWPIDGEDELKRVGPFAKCGDSASYSYPVTQYPYPVLRVLGHLGESLKVETTEPVPQSVNFLEGLGLALVEPLPYSS